MEKNTALNVKNRKKEKRSSNTISIVPATVQPTIDWSITSKTVYMWLICLSYIARGQILNTPNSNEWKGYEECKRVTNGDACVRQCCYCCEWRWNSSWFFCLNSISVSIHSDLNVVRSITGRLIDCAIITNTSTHISRSIYDYVVVVDDDTNEMNRLFFFFLFFRLVFTNLCFAFFL